MSDDETTDTADETVYLTQTRSRKRPIYHTDTDCWCLRTGDNYRPVDRAALTDEFRECKRCAAPEGTAFGGPGDGHYKSLLDAADANATQEGGDA